MRRSVKPVDNKEIQRIVLDLGADVIHRGLQLALRSGDRQIDGELFAIHNLDRVHTTIYGRLDDRGNDPVPNWIDIIEIDRFDVDDAINGLGILIESQLQIRLGPAGKLQAPDQ